MSLPEGWRETTLGEVVDVVDSLHKTPIYSHNGLYKMVRVTDIKRGNLNLRHCFTVDKTVFDEFSKKHLPSEFDIVFSRVGSEGIASLVKKNQEFCLGQNTVFIIPKERTSFLYYWLDSIQAKEEINARTTGSTQRTISLKSIRELNINLPPLPEQKSIAYILSSFDEKIELLKEQNETLEQMAQEVFLEWFVDGVDESWEVKKLGEILEIKRGGSPRPIKDYIADTGYRWLKISDATATKSPFIFEIKEHIKKEGLKKTTLLKKGSLVLSNSATPGIPKFLEVDSCIHDGWLHFPNSDTFSFLYLYLFFKHIKKPLLQQGSGSVFKNLKTDILKNWNTIIPDTATLIEFDNLVKPIFEKIKNNASQIQTLQQTRDTLLPKLMSGEVGASL